MSCHRELKIDLIKKGYEVDECDGSVILPLYDLYGERFVEHLDGMFAIAIIDETSERKLILTVDQAAIKSLFYTVDDEYDTIFFASEICALSEFPIKKIMREEAVNEYLIGRSMWGNKTFFDGIHVLEPGEIVVKKLGKPASFSSYNLNLLPNINESIDSFDAASNYLETLLNNEVEKMLSADVPVCLVTSGGLDSSLLTAIAAKHQKKIECFNIAYEGKWPSDEKRYAIEVAQRYGAKYNQVTMKESDFPTTHSGFHS
tara:strand:- start:19 stop:795 length:777 start_codon:yes stop_codon:yes gene_type:complete